MKRKSYQENSNLTDDMRDLNHNKRFRLGIIFKFSSNWMGGIIYILNIIKTLDHLSDDKKPQIILFYSVNLEKYVEEINYPYLETLEWSFPSLISGTIKSFLLRKNLFIDKILSEYTIDALFPIHDLPVRTRTDAKLIAWWADLQHKYYPGYFSRIQIWGRNIRIKRILKNADILVVSSKAVSDDFARFYCLSKDFNILIYHFVSIIENLILDENIGEFLSKLGLPPKYFLVSNQFHKHKNHKVVLQAIAQLKKHGQYLHVAFTGKLPAASNSPYLEELHRIIDENELNDQVTMLGMISRSEQLLLMKHSQAVIQPSLFEGWSTVIEDAIALQVPVVASNLKVNIEQLGESAVYFEAHNPEELASILEDYPERNLNASSYGNYEGRIKKAAEELIKIFT